MAKVYRPPWKWSWLRMEPPTMGRSALVLRNNITTSEHPMGVYHPHAELHHIKKENIGLIEVMGKLTATITRLFLLCKPFSLFS